MSDNLSARVCALCVHEIHLWGGCQETFLSFSTAYVPTFELHSSFGALLNEPNLLLVRLFCKYFKFFRHPHPAQQPKVVVDQRENFNGGWKVPWNFQIDFLLRRLTLFRSNYFPQNYNQLNCVNFSHRVVDERSVKFQNSLADVVLCQNSWEFPERRLTAVRSVDGSVMLCLRVREWKWSHEKFDSQ